MQGCWSLSNNLPKLKPLLPTNGTSEKSSKAHIRGVDPDCDETKKALSQCSTSSRVFNAKHASFAVTNTE
jgi:hypothetical protein